MNTSKINATVIGDGTPNTRTLLTLTTIVSAVTTGILQVYRFLTMSGSAQAVGSAAVTGQRPLIGSSSASAVTGFVLGPWIQKEFSSMYASGTAMTTAVLHNRTAVSGSAMASMSSSIVLASGKSVAGPTQPTAVTSCEIDSLADVARDEWTTRVPYENKETRVQ